MDDKDDDADDESDNVHEDNGDNDGENRDMDGEPDRGGYGEDGVVVDDDAAEELDDDLDDVNAFGPAGEKKTSKTPAKGGADAKSTKKRKQQKVVE